VINVNRIRIVIQVSVYKDIAMEIKKMVPNATNNKIVKAWFAITIDAVSRDQWC
jgi:hypothetical protein